MSNHTKKEGEKNEYWIIIMVFKNKKKNIYCQCKVHSLNKKITSN